MDKPTEPTVSAFHVFHRWSKWSEPFTVSFAQPSVVSTGGAMTFRSGGDSDGMVRFTEDEQTRACVVCNAVQTRRSDR